MSKTQYPKDEIDLLKALLAKEEENRRLLHELEEARRLARSRAYEEFLTAKEVAKIMKVAESTAYEFMRVHSKYTVNISGTAKGGKRMKYDDLMMLLERNKGA